MLKQTKLTSTALALIVVGGVAGCSTMEPPKAEISKARSYIDAAEQDEADRYAAIALNRAKDRMSQAQEAMDREDFEQAKFLAEKALVDARLASATAQTEKMREALEEVNSGLKSLNSELESES